VSDLVDILTAQAQSELWDQVVDQHNADWDANMRAIGCMLVSTERAGTWHGVYRVFVEQQGLAYEPGDAWRFLEEN